MPIMARKVTNFRLSDELREALAEEAARWGESMTHLVERVLREYLERVGRPADPAPRRRRSPVKGSDADDDPADE